MPRANLFIVVGAALILESSLTSCGEKAPDEESVEAKAQEPTPPEPAPTLEPTKPAADEPAPPTKREEGPCGVRWSDGRSLDFTYEGKTVKVNVDSDGDGQRDACGVYERDDGGRITSLAVDQGCDDKPETTLAIEYDGDANLATAKEAGRKGKTFTMVALPTFTGIQPGYLVEGDRKAFDIQLNEGLVRSIRATKGPAAKRKTTTFVYGADGRLASLQEDVGGNGSIETSYGYHYDTAGNVVGLTAAAGERRTEASFDYDCR